MQFPLLLRYARKYYGYEKGALIISSIPKSATHYSLFLIGNYLRVHFTGAAEPITPAQLYELFPNTLHKKTVPAPGQALTKQAGITDILWGHHYKYLRMSSAKKILFLYRNPLDQAVSSYNYTFVLKTQPVSADLTGKSFSEALPILLHRYASYYMFHKKNLLGRQALPISYEVLIRDTRNSFYTILHWLGVEVDTDHMDTAIAFSSKDTIRRLEKETGVTVSNTKGSFIREGKSGGWRAAFSDADLDLAKNILAGYGISFNEFLLD